MTCQTFYQIWAKSSNPRRSYCDFSIWPTRNDLEPVPTIARRSIFTKFELGQPIRCWLLTFYCWYVVALWPWPLTARLWAFVHTWCHVINVCTKSERNWTIRGWLTVDLENFRRCYVMCDLDIWFRDLERLWYTGCHRVTCWNCRPYCKSEWNRTLRRCVTDVLRSLYPRFFRSFFFNIDLPSLTLKEVDQMNRFVDDIGHSWRVRPLF